MKTKLNIGHAIKAFSELPKSKTQDSIDTIVRVMKDNGYRFSEFGVRQFIADIEGQIPDIVHTYYDWVATTNIDQIIKLGK